MRRLRRKNERGAILALVAISLIPLLMCMCLVLDFAIYKVEGSRLRNACALAQISANRAAGGSPANPEDPNDPWVATAHRILRGNGISEEELAASTIEVRDDGTVVMTVPRYVSLIHPHLWASKQRHQGTIMQKPPSADEAPAQPAEENAPPTTPYHGYDENGRYVVREGLPHGGHNAGSSLAAGANGAGPVQVARGAGRGPSGVASRAGGPSVRPDGVGTWFDQAPDWWTPPVVHDDQQYNTSSIDLGTPQRVYRPSGLGLIFENGAPPNWYPSPAVHND